MRTFITFEFDKRTKEEIAKVQTLIKENSFKGRFKHINNFHLTIKFLGETDNETIDEIYEELIKNFKDINKINAYLKGIDVFRSGNNIKTIFLNVWGEIEKIKEIAVRVDDITNKFGFKRDNKFIPHVTIAQDVEIKIPFAELKGKLEDICIDKIIFDKIVIMKSEEIDRKRIYTPLKTLYLR
ncbi:RNA 2',3'-cyclic phosphodiesterase [Caloramator australicus]|uniref:RNA 2',3'-cyclic phosphodiesterase n=1 Tax=Caloramator australicus RC3 TaxID=857293 RepID=I7KA42_9CLOT|nr:RNA 2',3'-cyclic phosphodiesterase [Caloramator australicus]CCJ34567.1 2'-5' RNA ligase [Caloramator australicus RC3]